ncbi:hypothetical protein Tco_0491558 [Tanacetum coccineum]
MCTYLKNMEGKKFKELKNKSFDSIQKMFDRAFKRVNNFVDFKTNLVEGSSTRVGEELEQKSTKKQKVDEDKDTSERQSLMKVIPDEEEVAIDVVPLVTKPPTIIDWKIHKEGKNNYYQIIRADGSSKITGYGFAAMGRFEDNSAFLSLKSGMIYMLVEKSYPLTPPTITYMMNKKLQVNYFSEMAYQLLKLLTNSLRINEVFRSILLVIMELLNEET